MGDRPTVRRIWTHKDPKRRKYVGWRPRRISFDFEPDYKTNNTSRGKRKTSINLPHKEANTQDDDSLLIEAIVTCRRSQRATQGHEDEDLETSQVEEIREELDGMHIDTPAEDGEPTIAARARTTQTNPSEEADHEINTEPHKLFQKQLKDRPDWRILIYNYIKTGELPGERWEARKIKARSPHYCIMEEKLYKQSLNETYLMCLSPKDGFTVLKQT